jgi:hypothetical protein
MNATMNVVIDGPQRGRDALQDLHMVTPLAGSRAELERSIMSTSMVAFRFTFRSTTTLEVI